MKKIFVLVMVMVATATSVFAFDQNEFNVFTKLNNKSTFKALVRYLDVNNDQADQLKEVFTLTEDVLKSAKKTDNNAIEENVLKYNLKNTKSILSENQYKKYLEALNVTLYNNEMFSKK
jgi:hypothetical protein